MAELHLRELWMFPSSNCSKLSNDQFSRGGVTNGEGEGEGFVEPFVICDDIDPHLWNLNDLSNYHFCGEVVLEMIALNMHHSAAIFVQEIAPSTVDQRGRFFPQVHLSMNIERRRLCYCSCLLVTSTSIGGDNWDEFWPKITYEATSRYATRHYQLAVMGHDLALSLAGNIENRMLRWKKYVTMTVSQSFHSHPKGLCMDTH